MPEASRDIPPRTAILLLIFITLQLHCLPLRPRVTSMPTRLMRKPFNKQYNSMLQLWFTTPTLNSLKRI